MSAMLLVQLLLVALFSMALTDAAAVLVARVRAQTAADGAALAAAAEQHRFTGGGGDPVAVAGRYAEMHGASLESCACPPRGETTRVVVRVDVRIRMLASAPAAVRARAQAAVDPSPLFRPR